MWNTVIIFVVCIFGNDFVNDFGNDFGNTVRNHVKLIHIVTSRRGFSKGTVLCGGTSYGLGRYLGDCRPALPKGRKYQMVKTQTESHFRRPVV